MTARARTFLAIVTLLAFSAPAIGDVIKVKDATGAEVEIADASRVVSIGGAITEILYALKLENQIAAVDQTSLYPPQARDKPDVGYMRALAAEGVLSVNPSVILAQEGAGPKETMAVLAAARVPMVVVPENYSGEGVVERVRLVAAAAGAPERGECLAASVARNLATLAETRARITKPLRVMFVLSFNNGRPMVAGRHTAADGIVKLAGGVNAMQEFQGYKQVTDEAVTAANPDVVLVMQRSGNNISAEQLFSHAAFSLTNAAKRKAFVSMEGLYLLGFGPRTAAAARDLAAEIYPELAGPPIAALATCS